LNEFCVKAKESGIAVMWDAILNHKAGADGKEVAHGVKVDLKGNALPLI
jgi:alpha-amylase